MKTSSKIGILLQNIEISKLKFVTRAKKMYVLIFAVMLENDLVIKISQVINYSIGVDTESV